jgi:hypothetical protein
VAALAALIGVPLTSVALILTARALRHTARATEAQVEALRIEADRRREEIHQGELDARANAGLLQLQFDESAPDGGFRNERGELVFGPPDQVRLRVRNASPYVFTSIRVDLYAGEEIDGVPCDTRFWARIQPGGWGWSDAPIDPRMNRWRAEFVDNADRVWTMNDQSGQPELYRPAPLERPSE